MVSAEQGRCVDVTYRAVSVSVGVGTHGNGKALYLPEEKCSLFHSFPDLTQIPLPVGLICSQLIVEISESVRKKIYVIRNTAVEFSRNRSGMRINACAFVSEEL